jgi:hypothetical protein
MPYDILCPYCTKKFVASLARDKHVEKSHPSITCSTCFATFIGASAYQAHFKEASHRTFRPNIDLLLVEIKIKKLN